MEPFSVANEGSGVDQRDKTGAIAQVARRTQGAPRLPPRHLLAPLAIALRNWWNLTTI